MTFASAMAFRSSSGFDPTGMKRYPEIAADCSANSLGVGLGVPMYSATSADGTMLPDP
jgi:hypothetical protein